MSASKNNLILGTTTDVHGRTVRRWMTPEEAAKAQKMGAGWREGTAAAAPASRAAVVSSPPTPATGLSALASLAAAQPTRLDDYVAEQSRKYAALPDETQERLATAIDSQFDRFDEIAHQAAPTGKGIAAVKDRLKVGARVRWLTSIDDTLIDNEGVVIEAGASQFLIELDNGRKTLETLPTRVGGYLGTTEDSLAYVALEGTDRIPDSISEIQIIEDAPTAEYGTDLARRWMEAQRDGASTEDWHSLQDELYRDPEAAAELESIEGSGVTVVGAGFFAAGLNETGREETVAEPGHTGSLPPLSEMRKMNRFDIDNALLNFDGKELPEDYGKVLAGHRSFAVVSKLWDYDYLDRSSEAVIRRLWDNNNVHASTYANDAYDMLSKAPNTPPDILAAIVKRSNYRDIREAAQAALDKNTGA